MPGFGYLERPGVVRSTRATLERDLWDEEELAGPAIVEEEDTSALPLPSAHLSDERCIVNLWICLSPTYHVPVLYFSAHLTCKSLSLGYRRAFADPSSLLPAGSPLTLDQILRSTIFHCPDPSTYPFSTLPPPSSESSTTLTDPSPSFPFLSQGEHPTLGMPAWFLHPCETEAIMRDVLGSVEVQGVRESEGEGWRGKWLETWLMVVGSVVDLKR